MFAAGLIGTAWLQRSDQRAVELSPSGPYRIQSTTGPIEVTTGNKPTVFYRGSWLLKGPTATTESGDLLLRCQTRWPCRASSVVALPNTSDDTRLEVSAEEDLLISEFAGDLTATTIGEADIILGPVHGTVTAKTERGAVIGYGLRTTSVDVETAAGVVDLRFLERPEQISVRSGAEAVTITLPPGDYAVSVTGGSSIAINVGQASDADSKITIRARGPVRIDPAR